MKPKQSLLFLIPCLILLIFFYPMLIEGKMPYFRDAFHIYYPTLSFLKQSILTGEYPLWNPYMSMGFAQWQSPDPNLIYPFNLIFLLVILIVYIIILGVPFV